MLTHLVRYRIGGWRALALVALLVLAGLAAAGLRP
jgi:hypothetical protein